MVIKEININSRLSDFQVMIADSVYAMMIYLLIGNKVDNTIFIIPESFPLSLIYKMPNRIVIKSIPTNKLYKLFYHMYLKQSSAIRKIRIQAKRTYGHDHLWYSSYFINNNMFLIEDGIINYVIPQDRSMLKVFRQKVVRNIIPYGLSPKVKKIYLTGKMEVPKLISQKVKLINLHQNWINLSSYDRDKINKIFDLSISKYEIYKRENVLLTGPFSEAEWMSENEKIKIYKKIINNYGENNIVIKPHPREITDYEIIFPDIPVMSAYIPFELYQFNMRKNYRIVTISSSASLGSSARIHYYDLDGIYKDIESVDYKNIYKKSQNNILLKFDNHPDDR